MIGGVVNRQRRRKKRIRRRHEAAARTGWLYFRELGETEWRRVGRAAGISIRQAESWEREQLRRKRMGRPGIEISIKYDEKQRQAFADFAEAYQRANNGP